MNAAGVTRRDALGVAAGAASITALGCGGEKKVERKPSAAELGRAIQVPDPTVGARFGEGDIGVVRYALFLEHFENDFYKWVVGSGLVRGRTLSLLSEIGRNEQEHVDALAAAVRKNKGEPVKPPATSFQFQDREELLEAAADIENLGAAAYLYQAPRILSREILAQALAIHTVEGSHAAALNLQIGRTITPDGSISAGESAERVLATVESKFLV